MKKLVLFVFLTATALAEDKAENRGGNSQPVSLDRLIQLHKAVETSKKALAGVDTEEAYIRTLDELDAGFSALEPIDVKSVDPAKAKELGMPDFSGLDQEFNRIEEKFKSAVLLRSCSRTPISLHAMGRCLGLLTPEQVTAQLNFDKETLTSMRKINSVSLEAMLREKVDEAPLISRFEKHLKYIDMSLACIERAEQSEWLQKPDEKD